MIKSLLSLFVLLPLSTYASIKPSSQPLPEDEAVLAPLRASHTRYARDFRCRCLEENILPAPSEMMTPASSDDKGAALADLEGSLLTDEETKEHIDVDTGSGVNSIVVGSILLGTGLLLSSSSLIMLNAQSDVDTTNSEKRKSAFFVVTGLLTATAGTMVLSGGISTQQKHNSYKRAKLNDFNRNLSIGFSHRSFSLVGAF